MSLFPKGVTSMRRLSVARASTTTLRESSGRKDQRFTPRFLHSGRTPNGLVR